MCVEKDREREPCQPNELGSGGGGRAEDGLAETLALMGAQLGLKIVICSNVNSLGCAIFLRQPSTVWMWTKDGRWLG